MIRNGPWIRSILASGAVALTALAGNVTAQTQSAPRWVHDSGEQNWIGKTISLGNRGTQVFAELGPAYPTRLFSAFDQDPPTPVWQVQSPELRFSHRVASAEENDVHASVYQIAAGTSGLRQPILARYRSSSQTPLWTYTFPFTTNGHEYMTVHVSKDGSRIVAAGWNIWTNKTEVAIFSANSPVPTSYRALDASGLFRSFLVSDDARVAYVMGSSSFKVFDLATGTQLASGFPPGGNVFDSHGMSADGNTFAYGGYNTVRVWRRNGSGYTETDTYQVPGSNYCSRIAISADGSTLAASFDHFDTLLRVDVRAWDLATDALLMSDTVVGSGSLQNTSGDLAISEDGSRFVLGLWGDAAGLSPEVRIYDSRQSTPLMVHDLPGSVLDVEISADGRRAAVASKAVHANTAGNGGSIELFEIGAPDFEVRGTPRVGQTIQVDVRGTPGTTALLLSAPEVARHPFSQPGLGTLYLRRNLTAVQQLGVIPSSGRITTTLALPNVDSAAGTTLYIQGLTNPPRRLTRDWEAVTVLPR
jgi:WD40 repeat protein